MGKRSTGGIDAGRGAGNDLDAFLQERELFYEAKSLKRNSRDFQILPLVVVRSQNLCKALITQGRCLTVFERIVISP